MEFADNTGVIDGVSVDSPAEGAELKKNDKIIRVNDIAITTSEEFSDIVLQIKQIKDPKTQYEALVSKIDDILNNDWEAKK